MAVGKNRSPEAVVLRQTGGKFITRKLAIYSMKTLKECEECEHWAGGDIGYGRKIPPSDGQKLVHISYMLHYTCGP